MSWEDINSGALAFVLGAALVLFFSSFSHGHDFWINHGGYHNKAGEWCCGDNDCHVEKATHIPSGWKLGSGELVREDKVLPSEDHDIWVCRVPTDNHVRCVFVPMESW
jgi:hypothetical protein